MNIITGAAGFIGSHLVESLSEPHVLCDPANKAMHSTNDVLSLLKSEDTIECVYHLGAISSTTENDIVKLTTENILFSCKLLNLCIEKNIPFVYASSASVYGSGDNGFSENAQLSPLNYYAISKASFDMYVEQKIKEHPQAKIFGLRYFNVYGQNEDLKGDMASPIHKFINQAKENKSINVFEGSDNFFRDFVYIDDVVYLTKNAPLFKKSGIYNVGTSCPRTFMDVAKIVATHINDNVHINEIIFPEHLNGKYQKYTCSNNDKVKSIGFDISYTTLEDGIQKVLNG